MKIGFFDSGLGGLTIFKEAINIVKSNYIYLGDNKNAPYGIKEKEEIKKYIFENVEYLVKEGCNIIVIACNTATSIAIDELREKYSNICIIGTEPAVKIAVDSNSNKRVLVCATSITVKEGKLKRLIEKLDSESNVDVIALDKLVQFAESKEIKLFESEPNQKVIQYIKEQVNKFNISDYSHVVLGCTHFPLFKKEFEVVFGKNIEVVDGSVGVAKNLQNKYKILNEEIIHKNKLKVKLINTKANEIFISKFKEITGIESFEYEIKV